MNISTADRIKQIKEYYFSVKLKEIAQLRVSGKDIINLGIGSPDLPPSPETIKALHEESRNPFQHGYQSYVGIPELRNAFANWYQKYFGVSLNPNEEILPLIGSKEGIMHISMTYLQAGDEVLVPNPGYPTYRSATLLTGASVRDYDLSALNNWYPDFEALADSDLSKVKIMWVNYPHMPTGTRASHKVFEQLIRFANDHQILIVNDNPYGFILNDEQLSILKIDGAKEVALELNSLSKSHNMAGWRIGMMAGHPKYLKEIIKFKSNMDSGMFRPMQLAAVQALANPDSWYSNVNTVYRERREKAFELLDMIGCKYDSNQVGMFVWAQIPEQYNNAYELSDKVLYDADVFLTPGTIFGSQGAQYIRISLCGKIEVFDKAIKRISAIESLVLQKISK